MASEGAHNRLVFDPFSMQLVRIVNSQGRQLFLDVISPRSDPDALAERHRQAGDSLHILMRDLEAEQLCDLSPMIPSAIDVRERPEQINSSWTRDYRDLAEWAELYRQVRYTDWPTDTLIVYNGLLRSKIFHEDSFVRMGRLMVQAIGERARAGITIFLAGIARRSQVLARYRLAMALEGTLPARNARYVPVPRKLEEKVYKWKEFARGPADERPGEERAKFVIGSLFLVRFGPDLHDPIWAVDLLEAQADRAAEIFGYLLQDAIEGFPVPYFPRCLQRAHEYAQAVDFDLDVLQDTVSDSVRSLIETPKRDVFDSLALAPDVAGPRSD